MAINFTRHLVRLLIKYILAPVALCLGLFWVLSQFGFYFSLDLVYGSCAAFIVLNLIYHRLIRSES